jgi:sensor c-di-GMP phosphodiesterase-like protein
MSVAKRYTALIVVVVCLAIGLPLVASVLLSRYQANEREKTYVTMLAEEALGRTEEMADQLNAGGRAMNRLPVGTGCSPAGIDLMRKVDLNSTLLQAVGHVDGNVMDCSSLGNTKPVDLGPPDFATSGGANMRTNVALFDQPDFLVVGMGRFVGIVHKQLPLSVVDHMPGLLVATFNWSNRKPLMTRGAIEPRWMSMAGAGNAVFRDDGYAVAVVRSKRYDFGTVAAVPLSTTARFAREAAMPLVPLSILTGALLALFLVRAVRSHASMPSMIRSALRSEEFHLLYQPVVDLATGRTVGAEALIRWSRPDGETISPDNFIAVAEQAGVIRLITARVLDLVANDVGQVLGIDPDFHFAVNFSAADIHSADIVGEVRRFVDRSGLSYDNLVIEATERSFVDVELARATIRQLREAGVKVAIDDFGTGYSSLGYLAELEVDYLKIDRLFVHALGTGSATSQVAARIIEMAKDLNLKIVAEGIETEDQAKRLKALKVELAQGYYYAQPMAVEALVERLRGEGRPHPLSPGSAVLAA